MTIISRYVAGIGIMTLTGAPALAQGVGATPPRRGGPVVPRTASPRNDPAATTSPAGPSGVIGGSFSTGTVGVPTRGPIDPRTELLVDPATGWFVDPRALTSTTPR